MADERAAGGHRNGRLRGEQRSGGARGEAGRDAWAVDGFAPLPGDAVCLPGGERATVETVYLCAEPGLDDVTRWSWIVLTDGRLLEVAPRGCALYDPPRVLARGTGPYLELVAQDGALVRFEERVRAGTWEARPVRLMQDGRRWRIAATGTVAAQRLGPAPSSPWGQLRSPHRQLLSRRERGVTPALPPGEGWGAGAPPASPSEEPDVYFTLAGQHDPAALGLGLWATDVVLAFGRRLGASPATAGLRVSPADQPT
jgi:hypothetical protein